MGDPAEENDPPPESIARMKSLSSVVNPEVTNYRTILMEKRTLSITRFPDIDQVPGTRLLGTEAARNV